jgi:tetratricopeptide (TPR) repeat protein
MRILFIVFIVTTSLLAQMPQHHHSEPANIKGLGSVSFPISCSRDEQQAFNRGVALLHSFSYTAAHDQFAGIAKQNPTCSMAYWGQAISLYRQLWDRPTETELAEGAKLVEQAQVAKPKTAREEGFIAAAAAFYSADPKTPFENRRDAYAESLRKLHEQQPGDDEAAIFYALSLMTSPKATDNNFEITRQAVTILEDVFARIPNHPGAAHYIIHACDNPAMAEEGLAAARRYASIAPDSAHALHMPSHIFTRLGLWNDDIQSNLASKTAAEQQKSTHDRLHAMNFLEYAYLQQGRFDDAKQMEEEGIHVPKAAYTEMPGFFSYVRVRFPSLYLLETRQWQQAEQSPVPDDKPDFQAFVYLTRAIAAGHLHDAAAALAAVTGYDGKIEELKKTKYAYVADSMKPFGNEAHAWLAFAEGHHEEAVTLLTETADKQDREGKGEVEIGARSMLADMLLDLRRPKEALKQYELSLRTDPGRFNALLGAARAASQAGDGQTAATYYRQLVTGRENFNNPGLSEAKNYLAKQGLQRHQ